jgi:hypothetical protein
MKLARVLTHVVKMYAMETKSSSSGRGMGREARTMRMGALRMAGRAVPAGRATDRRRAPPLDRIPIMPDPVLARSLGQISGGKRLSAPLQR